MKDYIKLPVIAPMSDSRAELRQRDDVFWKNYILFFLLKYYKEVNHTEIENLIEVENKKNISNIEAAIKKHIRRWLKNNPTFARYELIINLEALAGDNLEGYYDLKFEHSQWHHKYFAFEAKNMGKAKSMTASTSICEYVYTKKTKDNIIKEDGGMYRYFIGKYACQLNFAGMIGFVIGKIDDPVGKLIKKINLVYDNDISIGRLIEEKIIENSIAENPNTFDSVHLRQNSETKQNEVFRLHHIIMDFTQ
jgi:hypothetical protein